MLDFLKRLWALITGDIKSVVSWITRTIQAVYSWFDREISWLSREIVAGYHATLTLFDQAWHYIIVVYNYARYIALVLIVNVIIWTLRIVNDVWKFAHWVYNETIRYFNLVHVMLQAAIDYLIKWIMANIWTPLFNQIAGILHWIAEHGSYIVSLLYHPENLVKLIAAELWKSWLSLLTKYSKPIARWLIRSMYGLERELSDLIERILAAML